MKIINRASRARQTNSWVQKDTNPTLGAILKDKGVTALQIKKSIATLGHNTSLIPYTINKGVQPVAISPVFYDTAVLYTGIARYAYTVAMAKQAVASMRGAFLTHAGIELDMRALPFSGKWLAKLATYSPADLNKIIKNGELLGYIVEYDRTQDFKGMLNTPLLDSYTHDTSAIDEKLRCNEVLSKTFKRGSFVFERKSKGVLYKGQFDTCTGVRFTFKIYDKVHSLCNNTGKNPIGLTMVKSICAPREKHIKDFLQSDELKTHSIARVEITIAGEARHMPPVYIEKVFAQFVHLLGDFTATGEFESYLTGFYYPSTPTIIYDLRELRVDMTGVKASASQEDWLFAEIDRENDQAIGGVLVAHSIESDKSTANIQGLFTKDIETALQVCMGYRPVLVFTYNKRTKGFDRTCYGQHKTFKPLPVTSKYQKRVKDDRELHTDYHLRTYHDERILRVYDIMDEINANRGELKAPAILADTFPFNLETHNQVTRRMISIDYDSLMKACRRLNEIAPLQRVTALSNNPNGKIVQEYEKRTTVKGLLKWTHDGFKNREYKVVFVYAIDAPFRNTTKRYYIALTACNKHVLVDNPQTFNVKGFKGKTATTPPVFLR